MHTREGRPQRKEGKFSIDSTAFCRLSAPAASAWCLASFCKEAFCRWWGMGVMTALGSFAPNLETLKKLASVCASTPGMDSWTLFESCVHPLINNGHGHMALLTLVLHYDQGW